MRRRKGFTLLELLLVIFIIGILATAAVATFGTRVRGAGYLAEARSNISVIRSACEAYFQQYGVYPSLNQITTQGAGSLALIDNPSTKPGARWNYTITGTGSTTYTIEANIRVGVGGVPQSFSGASVKVTKDGTETVTGI